MSKHASGRQVLTGAIAAGLVVAPLALGLGSSPAAAADLVTVASIQGTPVTQGANAASPLANQTVTTRGVVTAMYRTGGYNGMYIQTGGTGGPSDTSPEASDAVFVFGSNSMPSTVVTGDSVEVTGRVSEFQGSTQVTPAAGGVTELTAPLSPVAPLVAAYPTTEAGREAHEGELVTPTNPFTVTNVYTTNQFAEIGLATGTTPLIQPTEVANPADGRAYADAVDAVTARGVVLDDGSSTNYLSGAARNTPLPWLSASRSIRVGAAATLVAPVILEYRNSAWKFQPTAPLPAGSPGTNVATFADTRPAETAPADVGGDIKLGTFNVLNYFNTTGEVWAGRGAGACTYYDDREGDPVTVNTCANNGPRGAAELSDFRRQQAKIVTAINRLDADIVSLEEIENSVKLNEADRDDALKALVGALNSAAGTRRWQLVGSPAASALPAVAAQDVIRTAFIYDPSVVNPVGASQVLLDSPAFANARQPLAQAFKPVGEGPETAFAVVVNHFKSKGDSTPVATGDNANGPQGAFNGDRTRQAQALVSFANQFAAARGIEEVFLTGDFNAYGEEDPLRVLEAGGFAPVDLDQVADYSYSFSGLSGSLDHVLANAAGQRLVTGADVWQINANEPIAYQYSRRNYNVTQFFDATDPFAASDHNPAIVGLTRQTGDQVELNLLNINDFHGRIDANTTAFATTVEQLRREGGPESRTLFLSAGDNIGASLFASSIQRDQPTIDVLNTLGLRTSSVGNHEFDRGFADLRDRVIGGQDDGEGREQNGVRPAAFSYLGANVYRAGTQIPVLDEYDLFDVDGVSVAVVGAVTQETPSLVAPGGIEGLSFGDPVAAVNRVTAELSDGIETRNNDEADVVIAEYHEGAGAGTPDGATLEEEVAAGGAFAEIVNDTSPEVDAIFTGHTHKQYAWDAPVPGEAGRTRPVLQTGSYGENVGQIKLTWDPAAQDVVAYEARNVPRAAAADLTLPRVQQVKTIVDAALGYANVIGSQPVGQVSADITTAYSGGSYGPGGYTGGARDDRAAESALGDLVANALRDGVSDFAAPDLGLTNPGGLRAELLRDTDGVITYAEANAVLPFNNTVALVDLTGAQIKAVLEQQWQTGPDGTVPSRPYLQLGMSDNVRVTADPTAPAGSRITSVYIDDEPLDPTASYQVSTLSFLAQGGDNFRAFTQGSYVDTGLIDADLWRDYLADNSPVAPDFARQQVFENGLPAAIEAGSTAAFQLGLPTGGSSQPLTGTTLDLTSLGSPANTSVEAVLLDGADETPLETTPVDGGVAQVRVSVPASAPAGSVVQLTALPSGTTVTVPVAETDGPPGPVRAVVRASVRPDTVRVNRTEPTLVAVVRGTGGRPLAGKVTFRVSGKGVFTRRLQDGRAELSLDAFRTTGRKTVTVRYLGHDDIRPASDKITFRVVR